MKGLRKDGARWKGAAPGEAEKEGDDGGGRKVRFGTRVLVWLVGGML